MNDLSELRTANILGAFALAIADKLRDTVETTSGYAAAAPSAIVLIGNNPNESIDRLRKTLRLSHSAAVRIADRLEHDGLIHKTRGADSRIVMLTLTPRGRAAMNGILDSRRAMLSGLLSDLCQQEWTALNQFLEKLMPRLVEDESHSDHICRLCDEDTCPYGQCPVEPIASPQAA